MRKHVKAVIGASALMAGLFAAPVLYAHEGSGSMPMMGQGSRNMMGGQDGMMGMMNMMGQMAQNGNAMMTSMMTNHGMAPNQEWQHDAPPTAPEHHDQSE